MLQRSPGEDVAGWRPRSGPGECTKDGSWVSLSPLYHYYRVANTSPPGQTSPCQGTPAPIGHITYIRFYISSQIQYIYNHLTHRTLLRVILGQLICNALQEFSDPKNITIQPQSIFLVVCQNWSSKFMCYVENRRWLLSGGMYRGVLQGVVFQKIFLIVYLYYIHYPPYFELWKSKKSQKNKITPTPNTRGAPDPEFCYPAGSGTSQSQIQTSTTTDNRRKILFLHHYWKSWNDCLPYFVTELWVIISVRR